MCQKIIPEISPIKFILHYPVKEVARQVGISGTNQYIFYATSITLYHCSVRNVLFCCVATGK